jgi:hypothetical protein
LLPPWHVDRRMQIVAACGTRCIIATAPPLFVFLLVWWLSFNSHQNKKKTNNTTQHNTTQCNAMQSILSSFTNITFSVSMEESVKEEKSNE